MSAHMDDCLDIDGGEVAGARPSAEQVARLWVNIAENANGWGGMRAIPVDIVRNLLAAHTVLTRELAALQAERDHLKLEIDGFLDSAMRADVKIEKLEAALVQTEAELNKLKNGCCVARITLQTQVEELREQLAQTKVERDEYKRMYDRAVRGQRDIHGEK